MRAKGWRKIATAVWGWPTDPQIYGRMELDATPLLHTVETLRERTGERVTVTHLVVRGLGLALAENPSVNTRLVRGHFLPRRDVSVFVIASSGAGKDLSGVKVRDADRRPVADIAAELNREGERARSGGGELERAKKLLEVLPPRALREVLRFAAFVTTDLGIDLSALGMPRESFGSAMVSSIGMFGVPEGWAPLSFMYRVPLIVLVGEIERRPWAVGDAVEVRPILPVTATIDHRWLDGHGVSGLVRSFRAYMADPLTHEDVEG